MMPATHPEIARLTAKIVRVEEHVADFEGLKQVVTYRLIAATTDDDRVSIGWRRPFEVRPGAAVEIVVRQLSPAPPAD